MSFRFFAMFGVMLLLAGVPVMVNAAKIKQNSTIQEVPEDYTRWLSALKQEMLEKGISSQTVETVFKPNYYHKSPEVVAIDRKQIEFVLTSTDYLNRVISEKKVLKGQQKYNELYPLFKDMEEKYGVPFNYLVAFWGMETNYGQHFGNFQVVEALTILSYDNRRPQFFRNELYNALQIIDKWNVDYTQMEGSWAGAMGHFQFMPSTFNAYAVDYNGDGKIDIWHSYEDAVASAANYLGQIGWKKDEPWGMEVSLPWNFDYAITGRGKVKQIKEWQKLGVKTTDNKNLGLDENLLAAVIVPEGKKGSAYLVLDNFKKIMLWNRSENYALAVGILADYVKSGEKWQQVQQNPALRVKTDDVIKVQSFINKLGWFKLDEDGQLGSKTREAIKEVQQKAKMPQDGYPDYQLLQKINKYNPEIGFVIPVQPKKGAYAPQNKVNAQGEKQTLRNVKKKLD